MSKFIFENPASIARAEVQRIEKSILALRAQHEPSEARDEQEASLWEQHAGRVQQLAAEPSREEQIEADAIEQLRHIALTAKVQNEAIDAAVSASKVEGVTPETVMRLDPDAVLAILADAEAGSTNGDEHLA